MAILVGLNIRRRRTALPMITFPHELGCFMQNPNFLHKFTKPFHDLAPPLFQLLNIQHV